MLLYKRTLRLSLPWVITITFIAFIIIFAWLSFAMNDRSNFEPQGSMFVFISGLVPGIVVALIQFLLSWAEFKQISELNSMKIKGVLSTRDQEEYYRGLLTSAQTKIDVLGVTASRFMNDFADGNSSRPDKKVLIHALKLGVQVRILVPASIYLSDKDRAEKFPAAERAFTDIASQFPQSFEARYFDHAPVAVIVRVDDDILVGPVFQNMESRNTPAVHTSTGSALAQSYTCHFEEEWGLASPLSISA